MSEKAVHLCLARLEQLLEEPPEPMQEGLPYGARSPRCSCQSVREASEEAFLDTVGPAAEATSPLRLLGDHRRRGGIPVLSKFLTHNDTCGGDDMVVV